MKMVGMTMNMVVLFSLILALGMLVDNAIVVVENIYRHMEQGYDSFEARTAGYRRGRGADHIVDADHAGAFLPLLFWPALSASSWAFCRRR
jgi:multidrug efflux pump